MRMPSLVAAMSLVALVACKKDTGNTADSARFADSAKAAAPAPAPAAAPLTDANIAALLDEANAADSASGKIASTRGTNADVKAFGVLMMRDHHALRKAGQDLVTRLKVTPTPPPNDSFPMKGQKIADSLNATPKGAFDKTYIGEEVAVHQQVLGLLDQFDAAAQAPELKDLLKKARPSIEMHLKRAQDIQSRLAADSTKKN